MENVIEWYSGTDSATLSLTSKRHITKVRKLKEKYPDEVILYHENPDGSVLCHLPLSWIKIGRPKQVSEEQRQKAAERLKTYRLR